MTEMSFVVYLSAATNFTGQVLLTTLEKYRRRIRRRWLRPRLVRLRDVFSTERLVEWPRVTVGTPEAPSMPFASEASGLQAPTLATPPIFSAVVRDGLFCTTNNVLLKSPRRMVAESYEAWEADGPCSVFRTPFDSTLCHQQPRETLRGITTAFRSIRRSFYHTLVDNIPRLVLLHDPAYAGLSSISVLADGPLTATEEYLVNALLPANCHLRLIEPGAVYRTEEFILLSHLGYQFCGMLHPAFLDFFRERVLPDRPSVRSKRILISRRTASRGRRVLNMDAVSAALAELGFEEHALEQYSIQQQIELFHDAEIVVGPHGAGLTNMLFAPHGTRIVELFGTATVMPHYYYMAKSLKNPYLFLVGNAETQDSDFVVDVAALTALIGV